MQHLDRLCSKSLLEHGSLPSNYAETEIRLLLADYQLVFGEKTGGTWLLGQKIENWYMTFRLIYVSAAITTFPDTLDQSFQWSLVPDAIMHVLETKQCNAR